MITELRFKRMCKVITGKLLIAAVIGATVLGTFGYAVADTANNATSVKFTDVAKGYWGYDYINFSAEKAIIKGYQQYDGTYIFAPENAVSYEEAATMLYRAMNAAGELQSTEDFQSEYQALFDENVIADWARPTIAYCLKYGIIEQSELAAFTDNAGTGQKAPRMQAAIWAAKALDVGFSSAYLLPYTDVSAIPTENLPYIDNLYRHGIMMGSLQTDKSVAFLPNDGIKRSEFAAISNRVYEAIEMKEAAGTSGYYDSAKETSSVRGTVASVDTANSIITLKVADTGIQEKVTIKAGADISFNGVLQSKGLSSLKTDITGKIVIISSLTGTENTKITQVHIDTQPTSLTGTVGLVEKVSNEVTIIGVKTSESSPTLVYYVIDSSTATKVTIKKDAKVTFIADGVSVVEII